MKREEAVRIIKECKEKGFKHTFYTLNEYHRALDRAIKALEQEPCSDSISRTDILDAIGHGTIYTSEELQKIIKALPPVNPQPKTGHWIRELIRNEKGGCIGAKMICSKCGNDNKHDEYMNYCPNCGAKMVKPQESEYQE